MLYWIHTLPVSGREYIWICIISPEQTLEVSFSCDIEDEAEIV